MHTILESYLETGKVSINKFHEPVGELISDGFAESLVLYDQTWFQLRHSAEDTLIFKGYVTSSVTKEVIDSLEATGKNP